MWLIGRARCRWCHRVVTRMLYTVEHAHALNCPRCGRGEAEAIGLQLVATAVRTVALDALTEDARDAQWAAIMGRES